MNSPLVITIGRQYGSGGIEIGEKLANSLGIAFYDKQIIEKAVEASGMCHEVFENYDEKPTSSFLYSLVMDTMSATTGYHGLPLNHKVFLAQFDAIKSVAADHSCVIVGRCADYALEERDNVFHIFFYNDIENRVKYVCEHEGMLPTKAREKILKEDKKRASYYNYYTNKKWGDSQSYDLCINTGLLGIDGTVALLKDFVLEASRVQHAEVVE